jgi:hypothetical protein
MFEKDAAEIAELRFNILDAMMDDSEHVEQVCPRTRPALKQRVSRSSLCARLLTK